MHDLMGDGDWIAEPGETIVITLEISNTGLTQGSPTVQASTADPYFTVEDSVTNAGEIAAGAAGHSLHKLVVSPGCPAAYVGEIEINMACPGGYAFADTVYVSVGDLAFNDDCESGEGIWTHGGTPDLWHLSAYRSHSGSSSWYFGNEGTHTYVSSASSSLTSQGLTAGEESRLSFWYWYDFTTYGVDGIYVILLRNSVPDTLDYIGSGGALNIVSRWVKWESPLDVTPGDAVAVRFVFKSDGSDVAEGIYLDDVALSSMIPARTGVDGGDGTPAGLPFTVSPNPADGRMAFAFAFAEGGARALIDIYDVAGRRVVCLVKPAGSHSAFWNLQAGNGARVAPGIYLATMRDAGYTSSRRAIVKLVVLR